MKKILLILIFIQLFAISSFSQKKFDFIVDDLNKFYQEIDKTNMETNILFNKGYLFLNDIELINNKKVSFTNINKYINLPVLINNSNYNSNLLIDTNAITKFKTDSNLCLSVICIKGDYLPITSVQETYLNINKPQYNTLNLTYSSLNKAIIYKGENTVELNKEYFFTNTKNDIKTIIVNFDDDFGDRIIDISQNQIININYNIVGEKSIKVKVISNNDTLISYSTINVIEHSKIKPTYKGKYSTTDINSPFYSLNKTDVSDIDIDEISFEYYEGCDGVLNKPVIIAEGFDLMNSRPASDLYIDSKEHPIWNDEVDELTSKGYDVFLINFDNSTQSIQENAEQMQLFIKAVNEIKHQNGSHHEGVYIGESMGGIIGRVALKRLENENPSYDHEFGLYVSYDSPQKGAYIPLGIQWIVADIIHTLPSYANNTIINAIMDLFYMSPSTFLNKMKSDAAKQLLLRHYQGNTMYNNFQSYLNNLGYPEISRNIAFTNGSTSGIPSEAYGGEQIFNYAIVSGIYSVDMRAWFSKRNVTSQKISRIAVLKVEQLPWYLGGVFYPTFNYIVRKRSFGQQAFTHATGSYINHEKDYDKWFLFLWDLNVDINFTFVPTVSAIDIDNNTFLGSDFGVDLTTNGVNNLINNNKIPFNDIYSVENNTCHTCQTYQNDNIIEQEIMPDNMYVQNREIDKDRDFEATESITAGKNISGVLSNYTHTKHINQGDVVIKNGATVNFTAGEAIDLKDGFTVENGADFTASIEPVCGNNKSQEVTTTYINPLEIIGSSKFCKETSYYTNCTNCDIEWRLRGENVDIQNYGKTFTTPNNLKYGQYTLYCTKYTDKGVKTKSKVIHTKCIQNYENIDVIFNKNINHNNIIIYPNPTKGQLKISSLQNIISQITITNVSGIVVFNKQANKKELEINISNLQNGIYFVKVITEQGEVLTEKIVKE